MPVHLPTILCNTTLRVVTAAVFWMSVLVFFEKLPASLRWPARIIWLGCAAYLAVTLVRALLRRRWSVKGVVFSLVLLMMMLCALHILCLVFMRVMGSRDDRLALRGEMTLAESSRTQIAACIAGGDEDGGFDPTIGWLPHAGRTFGPYTINKQGIRARHEFVIPPPNRDQRVLCMGDSFTLGVGVDDAGTYPAHAEQMLPGWEWLNFGIAGGCLTQAYLHYVEHARQFDGKYVIIGFMTNDAQRTVNCFRPLVNRTSGIPLTKPYAFIDDHGAFSIKPNPYQSLDAFRRLLANERVELPKLLREDYLTWGRTGAQVILESPITRTFSFACEELRVPPNLTQLLDNRIAMRSFFKSLAAGDLYGREFWNPQSKGFRALCAMFDQFHAEVIKDGRIPLIVIIPGPHDVDDFQRGDPRQYESLIRYLAQRNYRHLDFFDTLLAKHRNDLSEKELFVERHYQSHVNRELAEKIVELMQQP